MPDSPLTRPASIIPQTAIGHLGWVRGAIGAGIAIMLAGGLTFVLLRLMPGLPAGSGRSALPWLVAPLGASAVLVFAVPASPLAQPIAVIGGNLLSAAIGLGIGAMMGTPLASAGMAVALSIAVMSLTRALHPPGGACALSCALGAAGPESWSWQYLLPIAANVAALCTFAWLYNTLTGHPWPHRTIVPPARSAAPGMAYTRQDLEMVLADWNEVVDIDIDDLDAIYQALQRRIVAAKGRG